MAQFGAQKNPPWARPATGAPGLNIGSMAQPQVVAGNPLLSQPGMAAPQYSLASAQSTLQQQQQYTAQQIALTTQIAQQQSAIQQAAGQAPAILPQPGIAIPTTLATTQVATVSYPTPRAAQQQATQSKQRVFTGTITKLHDNFGFVDEDVFFQTSCVKGVLPKVGDRVLVEATYNANMPFKWNATRIQVLPNQSQPHLGHHMSASMQSQAQAHMAQLQAQSIIKPSLGAAPAMPPAMPPSVLAQQPPPPLMGQQPQPTGVRQGMQNNRRQEMTVYRERDRDRDRDRDRRERRERRSPRKRSRSPTRRSRSPAARQRSPQRRRPNRIVPRYMVQIPKISLDQRDANVISLRSRYQNLYVPSDFFNAHFSWADAFPTHRPFQLGNLCNFHVMHKEVGSVEPNVSVNEPNDADHLFSAKVMLMASPTIEELYHKSCALAEDGSDQRESFQHPTRLLHFLVGLKGKGEPMAIGGAWSPSLDGPNPEGDPRVLIKTAIRTTRTLTGIDLSACTQWYRFAEIRYHRPEEMHKGRMVAARVETVVLFLPDVWRCHPAHLEWDSLRAAYRKRLTDKLAEETREDETQEEEEDGGDADMDRKEPSHFSEIDPKVLKAPELRRELESRNLSSKGLKSQLIARLTKALKSEQEKEEQEKEEAETKAAQEQEKQNEEEVKIETHENEEEKKKEEEEKKKREEREKAQRERRYNLPDSPAVLVHPSPTAKNGKFDCTVMSLSVLLDYRPEDNKEHSFEVSLFAELFNEMLMRDFGFRIYKSLVTAPDRKEDEKKDEKKDKSHKDSEKKEKERSNSQEPVAKKLKNEEKEEKKDDKKDEKKDDKKDEEKEKEGKSENKKEDEEEDDQEEDEDEDKKEKDKKRDKDKDKKREKLRFCTGDPDLLMAFVYFDQNHTGYLLDKDVEEILHTIGLHLSRAQIKKLVQKVVSRDTLNYRKITDRQKNKEGKEGEMKTEPGEKTESADDQTLASGNTGYLGWLPGNTTGIKTKREAGSAEESSSGMVMYKGALVDMESVMQRLEKSEKTRTAVEVKLKDTQDEMDELKSSFTSSEQNSQKVALELQDLKKRLREQKKLTELAEKDSNKYMETLLKSQDALSLVLTDMSSSTGVKVKVKTEPMENGDA